MSRYCTARNPPEHRIGDLRVGGVGGRRLTEGERLTVQRTGRCSPPLGSLSTEGNLFRQHLMQRSPPRSSLRPPLTRPRLVAATPHIADCKHARASSFRPK